MSILQIENKKEYKSISCVYKLIFNTGYFYIGSTKNLYSRIGVWNNTFSGGKTSGQVKYIKKHIEDSESVLIEILSENIPIQELKDIEDKYLKENINDNNLINRAKSAFGNIGIKWSDEERASVSATKKNEKKSEETLFRMRGKRNTDRVHKYSVMGEYICSYKSYKDAALCTGISVQVIVKIINNKKDYHKGVVFKLTKHNSIPPVPERLPKIYKPIPRSEWKKRGKYKMTKKGIASRLEKYITRKMMPDYSPNCAKKVAQYNLQGAVIKIFPTVLSAANSINVTNSTLRNWIKKQPSSNYKGYIFKYA